MLNLIPKSKITIIITNVNSMVMNSKLLSLT